MLQEKVDKCLCTLIANKSGIESFHPCLLFHLLDLLIAPIISYSSEIWGDKDWVEIERIFLLICKLAIGVESSTLNNGIYTELSIYPLLLCRQTKKVKCMPRFWQRKDVCRYVGMLKRH